MKSISFGRLCGIALVARLVLIGYSVYHDARNELKYTDVDYIVFSDATAYLLNPTVQHHARGLLGAKLPIGDPYSRDTYRYTPLLAILLVPNGIIHPLYGKVLFAISDIVISILLAKLLRKRQLSKVKTKWLVSAIWLFNPMTMNISTRGSSEAVLGVMILSCLSAAESGQWDLAAILLGLATHFKIYPFIYGVSIVTHLSNTSTPETYFRSMLSRRILRFAFNAFGSFMVLNIVMYLM